MNNSIKIKTLLGIDCTIPVLATETIGQLKLKIENVLGFFSSEQILHFNGRILNQNSDTLCSCGIKYGDDIYISFRLSKFSVTVCLLDDRKFHFEINLTDNVLSLKSKLQSVQELSIDEQVLLYKGNILENNKSFSDSGISDNCVISLIPKLRPEIQITVIAANNTLYKILFSERETIHNLKKEIRKQIGFNSDCDKLVYDGKYLEDRKTIAEYHISEKSVIKVVETFRLELQIYVKTLDGKIFDIVINRNDKILNVKKKLQEKLKLQPDEQKMIFCGTLLCDEKTVDEYKICDKSVINIVARMRNDAISLFAKILNGNIIKVSIPKNNKIIDLKKLIQDHIKVDLECLKLIYRGIVLENDKKVNEFELCENSEIIVVIRSMYGINIFAKMFNGHIIALEVNKNENISKVKSMLSEKLKQPLNSINLLYQGKFLEDHETVSGCHIIENATIEILSKLRNS